ncbi:carbon starvation protein A [Escherichia coli]|uniref:Carbon starvation protein A n=1 Tax=Escherichia coli TaxID=562 RepID=A0A377E751_ECOLX|nr:carbon starvation protein A [Escherichia coli]
MGNIYRCVHHSAGAVYGESTCAICGPGRIGEVSVIGLVFLIFAIISGGWVAESPTWAPYFDFTGVQLTWMLVGYGFVAAVLPVGYCWPRVTTLLPS